TDVLGTVDAEKFSRISLRPIPSCHMDNEKDKRPPLHTELFELAGWTLDRTASFPKSPRHTFGRRRDDLCLGALEDETRARYAPRAETAAHLDALNLKLELMRTMWRLVKERGWISLRQALHAHERIDKAGRMAGAWRRKV